MDSARKRKASNATPTTNEGSASGSKRIKLLLNTKAPPSIESSVQQIGHKLIETLSKAQDKTGRAITHPFQELPDRDEYEDYYRTIKLPIAINTIEDKLKKNAYPTVTTLESDLKRMIQNAKDYNIPKSDIYEDAERIRKLVYNFMKVHNPAYAQDPSYTSFPTPIPSTTLHLTNGNREHGPVKPEPPSREVSVKPRPSTAHKISEPPSERKSSVAPSASAGDDAEAVRELDFTGKSFQEAQELLIADMMRHKDGEQLEIFTPFIYLPSRKLEDYYRVIKHPVSLKAVQKRIRGIHGREAPTDRTDFKNWDAFEQEVSNIWRNARAYNEDGSEMWSLANEFEYFKMRLKEAKEKVDEPAKPSIKLGASKPAAKSGITLNLSQHRNSPTPGVSVDNEALARQRQMVQAGVNSQHPQQQPMPSVTGAITASSQTPNEVPRPSSSALAGSSSAHGAQNNNNNSSLPAAATAPAVQPTLNGMMAPPVARPMSGSPFPLPQSNGVAFTSYHYTAPALLPPTQVRSYPASQALLPVVTISTDPRLKTINPYRLAIPPHSTLSHQSTTITLTSSHYYLQIAPTVSRELAMGRAYKIFVTVNGTRLTQRDTRGEESGMRTHVYEGSLASGVNRIEVEIAAAKVGADVDSKGLDIEKVTVFANLSRMNK